MKEDVLNLQLRKFLKEVGVTSQRVIETAVHDALAAKRLKGNETLKATMTLVLPQLDARHVVEGTISLE